MKKLFFLFVLTVCFCFSTFAEDTNFKGLAVKIERSSMITENSIDLILGICIKYRIDTLFVPAVFFMESLYYSRILPRSNVLINNRTPSDFDPMEYIIEKAGTFGILVIPAFDLFNAWPSKDFPINPLHVVNKHPEWISIDSQGKILYDPVMLDPGVPEFQSFCISIIREFMINYRPKAIAFIDFKYPTPAYGYNPFSVKEYEKWARNNFNKVLTFDDFRIYTLEDILRRLVSQREALGFSGNFFLFNLSDPDLSIKQNFQDWMNWVNAGLIDFSVMEYWLADIKNVRYDTSKALDKIAGGRFFPYISPSKLIPSQFELVVKELNKFSISGLVIDSTDIQYLNFLNLNKFGVPR